MAKNKKPKELSFEEKQNLELKSQLEKLRSYYNLPPVKKVYKVGQVVYSSSYNENSYVVEEVLDNGKIFLCSYDLESPKEGHTKGKSYFSQRDITDNITTSSPMSKKSDWKISFSTRELEDIISKNYYFGVDYSPKYQRDLVWTLEDKQNLIHSIFNNIEIGKFVYVEKEKNLPMFEILDGKQRASTIIEFYEDKFTYNGVLFSQLAPKDKRHFLHYPVAMGTANESITEVEKLDYFLKLNVSGVPQSLEHLAKVEKMLKKAQK